MYDIFLFTQRSYIVFNIFKKMTSENKTSKQDVAVMLSNLVGPKTSQVAKSFAARIAPGHGIQDPFPLATFDRTRNMFCISPTTSGQPIPLDFATQWPSRAFQRWNDKIMDPLGVQVLCCFDTTMPSVKIASCNKVMTDLQWKAFFHVQEHVYDIMCKTTYSIVMMITSKCVIMPMYAIDGRGALSFMVPLPKFTCAEIQDFKMSVPGNGGFNVEDSDQDDDEDFGRDSEALRDEINQEIKEEQQAFQIEIAAETIKKRQAIKAGKKIVAAKTKTCRSLTGVGCDAAVDKWQDDNV